MNIKMNSHHLSLIGMCTILMLFVGTSGFDVNAGADSVREEGTADTEQKINDLKARITSLREEMRFSTNDMWQDMSDRLAKAQVELDERWDNIKGSSAEKWEEAKDNMQIALGKTETLYHAVNKTFYLWSREQKLKDYEDKTSALASQLPKLNEQGQERIKETLEILIDNTRRAKDRIQAAQNDEGIKEQTKTEIDLTLNTIEQVYQRADQQMKQLQ